MDPLREEETMNRDRYVIAVLAALVVMAAGTSTLIAAEVIDYQSLTRAELEAVGLDSIPPAEPIARAVPKSTRATVVASLVVREGDTPAGAPGPVTALNSPFTDGNGAVGFTGAAGENFVWYDTGITWLNSNGVPTVLTGAEGTMGVSNTGGFIYSPSADGNDSVWTHNGLLLAGGDPAPGFPPPAANTFNSRPTMLPSGASYWVAGVNYTGGTGTEGRVLYGSSDSTPVTITRVLASGDMVGGFPIASGSSGIDFDYQISDNGAHHINALILETGSTANDTVVSVDDSIVARESFPTGFGDNWAGLDNVSINNAGHYLFSGDTDGATATDEFIAYNGTIEIREGDVIDGITLTSTASVNTLSLNNLDQAAYIWSHSGGVETLFFACDALNLGASSVAMLSTDDDVDLDGGGADAVVTDFNASSVVGPGLWLAEDGRIFVEVDLDFGSGPVEAIIALDLPACGTGLVINEVDYDQAGTDAEEFIEIHNPTGGAINIDDYSLELVNGTGGGAAVYQIIDLPDFALAPGGYYVVCGNAALVPNCDLDVSPDTDLIQNGAPDAVGLRGPLGSIVDTVSYEGDTGVPYTEGSGVGLEDDPGVDYYSISRYPDGGDTDQNNVDFSGRCNSPGLPNFDTTSNCSMVPVELLIFTIE
jgi:hypothetical protein